MTDGSASGPGSDGGTKAHRPTVLFVQEFGANLGHVHKLVAVAKAMSIPMRPVFVLPHLDPAVGVIRETFGPEAEFVQAPLFRGPRPAVRLPERTLADVFHDLGYADRPALAEVARRWRLLLDTLRPALIVADFAPTLRLVSWDSVPTVQVGCGFVTPPAGMRLPDMRDPHATLPAESRAHENAVLAAAQAVRAAHGGPPLRFFGDLFQGERVFVTAEPVLDPYAAVRNAPNISPLAVGDIACGPAFPERNGPAIFCYLWAAHPRLDAILTAINGIPRPSQVHIRGADPHVVRRNCAPQVGVRTSAADFKSLLPQTQLFIHYGGHASTYTALLAGVMQLIFPFDLEKEVTAMRAGATGGTIALKLDDTVDMMVLRRIIERQLDDTAMQRAALATAVHHRRTRTPDALPTVAAACEALIAARR